MQGYGREGPIHFKTSNNKIRRKTKKKRSEIKSGAFERHDLRWVLSYLSAAKPQ